MRQSLGPGGGAPRGSARARFLSSTALTFLRIHAHEAPTPRFPGQASARVLETRNAVYSSITYRTFVCFCILEAPYLATIEYCTKV